MTVTFGYTKAANGARIFYSCERGEGTPLLISHGLANPGASTMMHFEPALAFNRQLARGGSWYMYDCRDSGKSPPTGQDLTFEALVDDLVAVSDKIGEPFDLYGRTDGCQLAVALAARHPERVRRMLLVSIHRYQHDWSRLPEYPRRILESYAADPVGTLASQLVWNHPGTDTALALEVARLHVEAMPRERLRATRRAFAGLDLAELARNVETRALILTQTAEMNLAAEAAACLPNATVVDWNRLGDGTVNGIAWRQAWDEAIPPTDCSTIRPATAAAPLTQREREVLELVAAGLSNREIADRLVLSPTTVKTHVEHIIARLEVAGRTEAAVLAVERGWVRRNGASHPPK